MSAQNKQKSRWMWYDGTMYQPYDDETNNQIENAFITGLDTILLNKGSYFGSYENKNVYFVIFDGNKDHQHQQINKNSLNSRKLKRESAASKPIKSSTMKSSAINYVSCLINFGYTMDQINKAITETHPNLNNFGHLDPQYIMGQLMDMMDKNEQQKEEIVENKDENQDKYEERKQDINEYATNYEKGDKIEILIDNKWGWIHGLIIKTKKLENNLGNFERNKIITIKYKNPETSLYTEIILHGLRDKNKFRPLVDGKYDDHKFAFKYDNKNKNNDPNNAKHPAFYINRICAHCNGKGCNQNTINKCQRCKGTGNASFDCKKCKKSGITKKHCLIHNKCNGEGCNGCNETGRYPSFDMKCRACKGTGTFKPKCNGCNGSGIYNKQNSKQCISGYLLNATKPFVPQRNKLRAYGVVGKKTTKRLFHVTDDEGAVGIKETGVMYRGNDGSYGGGIYFAETALKAASKARHKGYLVICDVFIGKVLDKNEINVDMNFDILHGMGYDSIKTNWKNNGNEYVVYHWDQAWVHIVLPFEKIDFHKLN